MKNRLTVSRAGETAKKQRAVFRTARPRRSVRRWISIGAASDADDFETEHRIYHEDAVAGLPAVRRANPRSTQHTEPTS